MSVGAGTDWQRHAGVLAWPDGWQRPNRTEEWAWERCRAGAAAASPFVQMLCFPWATLIDLMRRGRQDAAAPLREALRWAPPRITLRRATVMQHIWAKDMLAQLQALRVTDVYWSHAVRSETQWPGGIQVHPFPLYPVCCGADADPADTPAPAQRRWLYSFIGAYEPGLYLSPVRRWILELPAREDARVERRAEWHFEGPVYRRQIEGLPEDEAATTSRQRHEAEYREALVQSVFSLCPSGSGPNSIRLWESLGLGAIPVLMADTLRLPGDEALWREAAVLVPERREDVMALPQRLRALASQPQRLQVMREAGRRLWLSLGVALTGRELAPVAGAVRSARTAA